MGVKIKIDGDSSGFDSEMRKVKNGASDAGNNLGKQILNANAKWEIFKKTVELSVKAIEKVVDVSKQIVEVGAAAETSFAKVQTIMDTTAMSTDSMKQKITELSTETGVAFTDLSNTVYNAISATGDTANAVGLAADATRLATAGFTDTDSALGILTTTINAYGMATGDAEKISDSLVQTQNLGVTTIADLSSSMGKAIASASAYGIDLYNVESAYVSMTKAGINTAESTTYMSSMFKELGDSGSSVAKALKAQTGESFAELMADGKSLGDVLEVLYASVGNNATAMMNLWSSAEAGKASNAILNQGIETYNENLAQLQNSSGTTADAYATMCDTFEHSTETLKNSVTNLGIDIYDSVLSTGLKPVVDELNSMVGELTSAFNEGGLGDLLDNAVGMVSDMIPNLIPSISEKLLYYAGNLFTNLGEFISKRIPELFKGIVSKMPTVLSQLTSAIPKFGTILAEFVQNVFSNAVPEIISSIVDVVPQIIDGIFPFIFESISSISDIIDAAFDGIFEMMGVKLRDAEYDSLGSTKGELTYAVETDATVNNQGAREDVDSAKQEFIDEMKGYGLTTESIVQILAFQGTTSELLSMLESDYPDMPTYQRLAIMSKFGDSGMGDLISALSGYGLTDDTILQILEWKSQGDDASISALLASQYPDVKQLAIDALTQNWNDSSASFNMGDDSASFATSLLKDMFTDGKKDDPESVQAMLDLGKSIYDSYTESLNAYIKEHGSSEETEAATAQLDAWNKAYSDYITAYANGNKAACEEAITELESLSSEMDTVMQKFVADQQQMISVNETLYNMGKNGSKLSDEDLKSAMTYVDYDTQSQLDALEEQKQQLLSEEGANYEEIEAWYQGETDRIAKLKEKMVAELLLGQSGGSTTDLQIGSAVLSIDDFLSGSDVITQDDVAAKLKEMGYSEEVIQGAIEQLFPNGATYYDRGVVTPEDIFNHMDLGSLGEIIQTAFDNGLLNSEEFKGMSINEIIAQLINSDNIEVPDEVEYQAEEAGAETAEEVGNAEKDGAEEGIKDTEPTEYVPPYSVEPNTEAASEAEAATEETQKEIDKATEEALSEPESKTIDSATLTISNAEVDVVSAHPTDESHDVIEGAAQESADTVSVHASASVTAETDVTIDTGDAASKGNQEGVNIGFNIGAGIVKGLTNTQAWVVASARAMAEAAALAIKEKFAISSPSKLMIGYGEYVGEGLAIGMQEMTPAVVESARTMAKEAIGIVDNQFSGMSLNTEGITKLGDRVADLNETVASGNTYTFNVNGKALATATAADNNSSINAYSRRIALGYGRG